MRFYEVLVLFHIQCLVVSETVHRADRLDTSYTFYLDRFVHISLSPTVWELH